MSNIDLTFYDGTTRTSMSTLYYAHANMKYIVWITYWVSTSILITFDDIAVSSTLTTPCTTTHGVINNFTSNPSGNGRGQYFEFTPSVNGSIIINCTYYRDPNYRAMSVFICH